MALSTKDFLMLVPHCTREQLEACCSSYTRDGVTQVLQARYRDLCDGKPPPHELEMVILQAVHSREKRDLLELLRTAVRWKKKGELSNAIDICREAVQLAPTCLWSRKLLTELEKMKADLDCVKQAERLSAALTAAEEAGSEAHANAEPSAAKRGCPLNVLFFAFVISMPFVAATALRSTPSCNVSPNSSILDTR